MDAKFKALLKEWNAKLKESGFEDCEKTVVGDNGDEETVLAYKSIDLIKNLKNLGEQKLRARIRYYELLSLAVAKHQFDNPIHEQIMTRTAEGKMIVDIIKEFQDQGKKIHRETIRFTIRKYEHIWKIKTYSQKQLKRKIPTKS